MSLQRLSVPTGKLSPNKSGEGVGRPSLKAKTAKRNHTSTYSPQTQNVDERLVDRGLEFKEKRLITSSHPTTIHSKWPPPLP